MATFTDLNPEQRHSSWEKPKPTVVRCRLRTAENKPARQQTISTRMSSGTIASYPSIQHRPADDGRDMSSGTIASYPSILIQHGEPVAGYKRVVRFESKRAKTPAMWIGGIPTKGFKNSSLSVIFVVAIQRVAFVIAY